MVKPLPRFHRWYHNSPIRTKLMIGFGIILSLVAIMLGANYLILQSESDARDFFIDAQIEASLAQNINIEYQKARGNVSEAGMTFLREGLEPALVYYEGSQLYSENILGLIADIEDIESDPGVSSDIVTDDEFAELEEMRGTVNRYIDLVSDTVELALARGTRDTGMVADIYAPLDAINPVINAGPVFYWLDQYTESLSSSAVLEMPLAFTGLQNTIYESDLPEGEQARLKGLLDESRAAFTVLVQHDMGLMAISEEFEQTGEMLSEQVDAYYEDELAQQAEATANLNDAQRLRQTITPILAIGTLLMSFVLALGISRSITVPIISLTDSSRQIADGNYDLRVNVGSRDEIGQLGESFNTMVDAISQREHELIEQTKALRVATARAKEAARIRREFLANVSHELRTPLNAIIGFSDGLIMGMYGELTPKQHHKTERLRENGVRLLSLVNDILDLTRIEVRRIEIQPAPFAPAALVSRMEQQMEALAEEKRLDFTTVIDPAMPATLVADEQRIEQIVVNLLSNAFKFTQQGSVSLQIHAQPAENTWKIAVKDTGIGIPAHAKDIIFEEFRQVDGSSTRAYKGSGLGLAITRNLVRLMDGQINVESEPGQGSTFTVTLPMITEVNEAEMLVREFETVGVDS